jgi:hypothetical protein
MAKSPLLAGIIKPMITSSPKTSPLAARVTSAPKTPPRAVSARPVMGRKMIQPVLPGRKRNY